MLEADGQLVCRASCVPAVESLLAVGQEALAGAPEGTRLAVVFEPAGPAWMPVAVFFARRGHDVFRVSSAKAADLRRHAKSNGIDADTLARMPLADPRGLQPLERRPMSRGAVSRRKCYEAQANGGIIVPSCGCCEGVGAGCRRSF